MLLCKIKNPNIFADFIAASLYSVICMRREEIVSAAEKFSNIYVARSVCLHVFYFFLHDKQLSNYINLMYYD